MFSHGKQLFYSVIKLNAEGEVSLPKSDPPVEAFEAGGIDLLVIDPAFPMPHSKLLKTLRELIVDSKDYFGVSGGDPSIFAVVSRAYSGSAEEICLRALAAECGALLIRSKFVVSKKEYGSVSSFDFTNEFLISNR